MDAGKSSKITQNATATNKTNVSGLPKQYEFFYPEFPSQDSGLSTAAALQLGHSTAKTRAEIMVTESKRLVEHAQADLSEARRIVEDQVRCCPRQTSDTDDQFKLKIKDTKEQKVALLKPYEKQLWKAKEILSAWEVEAGLPRSLGQR